MNHRMATLEDLPVLTRLNRQLVEDENHRHRFQSEEWLVARMREFLTGVYEAVLFEEDGEVIAYALYRHHPDHEDRFYVRHFFVNRELRRRGVGQSAMRILREQVWPANARITVEVLIGNSAAKAFFEAVGFRPYSMELELPALGNRG